MANVGHTSTSQKRFRDRGSNMPILGVSFSDFLDVGVHIFEEYQFVYVGSRKEGEMSMLRSSDQR